ncbi:MAG TPA: hypothetical protein VFW05_15875 [Verrucomicrobiae bacterium]|nr:hypothetical protein [Verrucomicrobiae bacterium]
MLSLCVVAKAETVSIVIPTNASPRVQFGADKLAEALKQVGYEANITRSYTNAGRKIAIGRQDQTDVWRAVQNHRFDLRSIPLKPEHYFCIDGNDTNLILFAADDSGVLYGCLDFAPRVRDLKKIPERWTWSDGPKLTLRGACVAMQKTYILPGRKVYEYPYTPELFPWFYDKELWREYLDTLVENRMNTLYLWNGHPFASLVKLKDYPEAVEVPDDVFQKNVEMFHWLTAECDRRGIWLVQMFYNIFLPKPLAEKHGVSTQLSAPTPLASDYTRKSIAEFVKQYPNVGLMVCLGEALQGTENQLNWCTNTILPGVLDGMKAAGLKEQPPVVIRTHAMNPQAIMPACFTVYSNLFTITKYNGESLTTYEPRGKNQATHLAMAKLGPHLVNVHILSNLEPFRYGATEFIRKSVLASRDRLGASGVHLYPLAYWNWPYSPDAVEPPLKQWQRDWIWFEAWARYAWNPDVPAETDRAYWISRLTEQFGNTNAAAKMLDAFNEAGEVAPMLIRRFGITEGNRQTLSLGMTLDQLVNPKRYGVISDLWESQSPPGERLDEFVRKEMNHEAHVGETPETVIADVLKFSSNAVVNMESASALVTKNRGEFECWLNDLRCIQEMAKNYAAKVKAAELVLRYEMADDRPAATVAQASEPAVSPISKSAGRENFERVRTTNAPQVSKPAIQQARRPALQDMLDAEKFLAESLKHFEALTALTTNTYRFANSMQTGHRKIPFGGAAHGVGTNYHWSQVLPLYRKELDDFRARVAELRSPEHQAASKVPQAAWPVAKFRLLSTNAETYEVKVGARPFTDRKYTITELAPQLKGLTGIRFSHEEAKNGRYVPIEFEVSEPVRVLVGYFQNERDIWLQVPNLDVASQADERGGVDVLLRDAARIEECPSVNVHAFRYEPGRHRLELIGKGSFVVLGVVPQSAELK